MARRYGDSHVLTDEPARRVIVERRCGVMIDPLVLADERARRIVVERVRAMAAERGIVGRLRFQRHESPRAFIENRPQLIAVEVIER